MPFDQLGLSKECLESLRDMILTMPFDQLGLSKECLESLRDMKLYCLQEFIDKGWQSMRDTAGFNYRHFNEVIKLLNEKGLLHLMESR